MGRKYTSYPAQREVCRLNKGQTYTEVVGGAKLLFCNYPFTNPHHRKGLCKASTCTDLRQIPQEIVDIDEEASKTTEDSENLNTEKGEMACPSNE